MDGIQFLVDGQGKKTAVQIDLEKHSEIWEDFYDTCLARERVGEPREYPRHSEGKVAGPPDEFQMMLVE